MNRVLCAAAALLIALPFIAGCGGSGMDLQKVHGTVTLDGNPVEGAEVIFTPSGEGASSAGTTDATGAYTLYYSASEEGAVLGSHRVEIFKEVDPGDVDTVGESNTENTIPAKYNIESELTEDVADGDNEINFTLTSD